VKKGKPYNWDTTKESLGHRRGKKYFSRPKIRWFTSQHPKAKTGRQMLLRARQLPAQEKNNRGDYSKDHNQDHEEAKPCKFCHHFR
jgi:hypothetical protein